MIQDIWYRVSLVPASVYSHCVKSVQIRSFFWSMFSRIRTEYGEIRIISPNLIIKQQVTPYRTKKKPSNSHNMLMTITSLSSQKNQSKKYYSFLHNMKLQLEQLSTFLKLQLHHQQMQRSITQIKILKIHKSKILLKYQVHFLQLT